ncbi:hypothetical protein [Sphingomonas sp.]|jgi:hypothetical protein|uniref:hypothetical protein n=1 Tax=Sphingomonas sp. TaxID=28214 RepID=UPI002D809590|nr:hypothetical protein [Sphingomonas sp.]HEU0043753.1 hypothetical protein [Sphingomonas sp.]
MATIPDPHEFTLDIREQVARIDRMQVEIGKWKMEMIKTQADVEKVRQDTRLAPLTMIFAALGAASAFFGAGLAVAKYLAG